MNESELILLRTSKFNIVKKLQKIGLPIKTIAKQLDMSYDITRLYAKYETYEEYLKKKSKPHA